MMDAYILVATIVFGLLSRPLQADVPRCDKDSPDFTKSPYCLPVTYNKDLIPPTEGPLHINVDIFVFEVSRIDDISLSMTFELYFDLTWSESRMLINESATEWEVDDSVMGSTNFIKSLWLPDIQILNLKQFQKRQIVTDVAGLIIFKNKKVLYTISTEAIISCPMKFSAYPLDHQECKFHVGSYIHDATQISFTGTFGHDTVNQRAQQYEINITALDEADTTVVWANRNYSQTGFKINLIRRRTPVLLQTYLPSLLFVVVSWVSFIVPPEIVPGRMALLVTLFLVLVNIFNSVTANAPKSEGLTAVETWVVMCILHVFCVLLEYAFILKIIQIEKRKVTARMRKVSRANDVMSASNMSLNNKSLMSFAAANLEGNASGKNGNEITSGAHQPTAPSSVISNHQSNSGFSDRLTRCFVTSSHCCQTPKSPRDQQEECYENGASASAEKLEAVAAEAQRQLSLHRNCGCDDHAHHHRVEGGGVGGNGGGGGGVGGQAGVDRRKNRPKTASSPTQTEQVVSEGVGRGPFLQHHPHMAPHHPLLAGIEHVPSAPSESSSGYMTNTTSDYPRHRHLHHRSSSHHGGHSHNHATSATGGRGLSQAMPLHTFSGSRQEVNESPSPHWQNQSHNLMTTPAEQRENEKQSLFGTNIDFDLARGGKSAPGTSGNSPTQSLSARSHANDHLRLTAKYEKIDRIATWLFPIIFLLFNVIYWSYYLLLSDALQEIWNCGGFGECAKAKKQCDNYAHACDESG